MAFVSKSTPKGKPEARSIPDGGQVFVVSEAQWDEFVERLNRPARINPALVKLFREVKNAPVISNLDVDQD